MYKHDYANMLVD